MSLYNKTVYRQTLQTAVLKYFLSEEMSCEAENAAPNCAASPQPTPSTGLSIPGLLDVGVVMGRITVGGAATANAVAGGSNVGNGSVGSESVVGGQAQVGSYSIQFTSATAYNVYDPKGVLVGSGVTGAPFSNQINFTITAGGTAFAAGDSFTIAVAPATSSANAGNTGNGTIGTITAKTGIQVGTYAVEFVAATKYNVYDPSGKLVGEGATGAAFANQLGFTITAGGTAFAAGDGFTIVVAQGNGNVTPLNLTAVDGSAVAMGVNLKPTTVPAASTVGLVLLERIGVVLLDGLIWPAGITASQQAAALAQLASNQIVARAA